MSEDPKPYQPEEGAAIYRLCDVPEGWPWRIGPEGVWSACNARSTMLVEARPPRPVMVEVPADEVIAVLGMPSEPRLVPWGPTETRHYRQRLLDKAWAAKDAAS